MLIEVPPKRNTAPATKQRHVLGSSVHSTGNNEHRHLRTNQSFGLSTLRHTADAIAKMGPDQSHAFEEANISQTFQRGKANVLLSFFSNEPLPGGPRHSFHANTQITDWV